MATTSRNLSLGTPGWHSHRARLAGLYMMLAVLLGGGGSPSPIAELMLQWCLVPIVLVWLWLPARFEPWLRPSPMVYVIGALALLLPFAQLVPLPPSIWQGLPGRTDAIDALTLIGAQSGWRPLSLAPGQTMAALVAMLPPLFVLVAVASLQVSGRQLVIAATLVMICIGVIFGAMNVLQGGSPLYSVSHGGWLTGFQANRNAEVDVILVGLLALAYLARPARKDPDRAPRQRRSRSPRAQSFGSAKSWMLLSAGLVLIVATIMTGSRMGIALLPLCLLICWLLVKPALPESRIKSLAIPALALVGVGVAIAAFIGSGNRALGRVADRFALTNDFRFELWQDTWYAIAQYWPAGYGLGGFVPAMLPAERLEVLDPTRPNRAHNDYLELLLESGVLGIAILIIVAILLIVAAIRSWRAYPQQHGQILFGAGVLAIVALHSIVDYPLRSMSLACIAALGAALLMPVPSIPPPSVRPGPTRA